MKTKDKAKVKAMYKLSQENGYPLTVIAEIDLPDGRMLDMESSSSSLVSIRKDGRMSLSPSVSRGLGIKLDRMRRIKIVR